MGDAGRTKLAGSLVLLVLGIGFAVVAAIEASAAIRIAEPLTLFGLISTAAALSGLLGGAATFSGWLKDRANRHIALSIMTAFLNQSVIPADDLIEHSERAFYVLKPKGDVRGEFDRDRCKEGITRLRFEGHICADTSGLDHWWHRTYSAPPQPRGISTSVASAVLPNNSPGV